MTFTFRCNVLADIHDLAGHWGGVRLVRHDGGLALESGDRALLLKLTRNAAVNKYLGPELSPHALAVPIQFRGMRKQALTTVGWPVEDLAGYTMGTPLAIGLRPNRFRKKRRPRFKASGMEEKAGQDEKECEAGAKRRAGLEKRPKGLKGETFSSRWCFWNRNSIR